MSHTINLSGRWVGHYHQYDHTYPISAELNQQDERVTGLMEDGETAHEMSLFEATTQAGLPPGADEELHNKLREMFPEEPKALIRAIFRQPRFSDLAGEVRGDRVVLLKTYQGESFSGYRVGEHEVGQNLNNSQVHYSGEISEAGGKIEGQWYVPASSATGGKRLSGSFVLEREKGA